MLQAIREKTTGWITYLLLGLIVIAMVAYVLPSFFGGSTIGPVIKAGELEVAGDEWQRIFNQEAQRDPSIARGENKLKKRELAERVIEQKLFEQLAIDAGMGVSTLRLRKAIEEYAGGVFKLDGKFNEGVYTARLQSASIPVRQFERDLERELSVQTIPESLSGSVPVADSEVDRFIKLRDQTRDVRMLKLALADIPKPEQVSDAEIKAYYDGNSAQFMSEEQLNLEYLWLKASDVNFAPPSEDDLKANFEKRKQSFISNERRMASHILVQTGENPDAEKLKAALEKAEALSKRAKAGEDFAQLARENSDDAGSKEEGGDLGWLEKGVTDPAFESALFGMKAGDISEPVKGAEGYHIIQLREVQAETQKSFEEVRGEIELALTKERRDAAFNELLTNISSELQNDLYQLSAPAKKSGRETVTTGLVNRSALPAPLNTPEVAQALMKETVIERGAVSDRIKIGEDSLWLRVVERKAAAVKPLDQVKEQASASALSKKHETALKTRADELLKRLKEKADLNTIAEELKKTVETKEAVARFSMDVPGPITQELFKATRPKGDKPTVLLAANGPQEYFLVELTRVKDGDLTKIDAAARDAVRAQLRGSFNMVEFEGLKNALKQSYPSEIREDRL
jgi:peptidyl-prolyl cis-trans isomerase D